MDIAWFRDLSVIVLAIVVVTMVIVIGVIAIKLYRRARPIIDSVKATAANMQEITSFVKEAVVKPMFTTSVSGCLLAGLPAVISLLLAAGTSSCSFWVACWGLLFSSALFSADGSARSVLPQSWQVSRCRAGSK